MPPRTTTIHRWNRTPAIIAPIITRVALLRRIFGYDSEGYTGIFRMRHPTLLTPRDFDLSPYFETIKFNVVADARFDYQRIQWAELEADRDDYPRPYGAPPPSRADGAH